MPSEKETLKGVDGYNISSRIQRRVVTKDLYALIGNMHNTYKAKKAWN